LTNGQRFKGWHSALFEQKCRALWALQRYVDLEQFCDECCKRIPGDPTLLTYQLSAQRKLGNLSKDSEVVSKLISVVNQIQAPWQFVDLVESLKALGELRKAKSVLQIARNKFPIDQAIGEILI
jgi:arginine utilization protein RocB